MRILSGIQPTGKIHIGNYLGAIKHWVKLQEENKCIFFIADLHSLTVPYNPKELQKNIYEAVLAHFAVGIDPKKSIFFVQSEIKEHTELAWLLNTVSPVSELERMTQYKEKSGKFKKNINAGLLNYPVLQAADILIYQTEKVPVGKDQIQHIELTRTIARKFNQRFGETFTVPEAMLPKVGAKIMSLENPKNKMSKSDKEKGCIFLFDSPKEIKQKIMSAKTDIGKEIKYKPKTKPGISNLLLIYSLFSNREISEIEKEFKNRGYAEFKKSLVQLLTEKLASFRKKRKELSKNKEYIEKSLKEGTKKAKKIAEKTMTDTRKKMGLV